jgi:hypothetical protein
MPAQLRDELLPRAFIQARLREVVEGAVTTFESLVGVVEHAALSSF